MIAVHIYFNNLKLHTFKTLDWNKLGIRQETNHLLELSIINMKEKTNKNKQINNKKRTRFQW